MTAQDHETAARELAEALREADEIIRQLCGAINKHVPSGDRVFLVDVRVPERAAVLARHPYPEPGAIPRCSCFPCSEHYPEPESREEVTR